MSWECPKRMVYGPCGGVRPDGACEVDAVRPCTFVGLPLTPWAGKRAPAGRTLEAPAPRVVTDLHVVPRDLESLRSVADRLAGTCDGVLAGDHAGGRNDFAPSFLASELLARGLRPWITLSCRDRNRTALGAELSALAQLGVAGVHCVTGDWQGLGTPRVETKVFDLDCLRLVDMARSAGLPVSVAATPAAPPYELRPARLAEKVAAGAQICFVNHCGGPGPVGRFVAAARDAGADIAYLACVAVTTDPTSLAALAALPGITVDAVATTDAMEADAADAVAVAVASANGMLGVSGVDGINLSGTASSRSVDESARMMSAVGARLTAGRLALRAEPGPVRGPG